MNMMLSLLTRSEKHRANQSFRLGETIIGCLGGLLRDEGFRSRKPDGQVPIVRTNRDVTRDLFFNAVTHDHIHARLLDHAPGTPMRRRPLRRRHGTGSGPCLRAQWRERLRFLGYPHFVTQGHSGGSALPPVDTTLTRVVLLMRLLGWGWLVVIGIVDLSPPDPGVDVGIVIGALALATAGAGLTVLAARRSYLGEIWYVVLDAGIAVLLAMAGRLAGLGEFLVGGYPVSWLFIVAFATTFRGSVIAGLLASAIFAVVHLLTGITDSSRIVGSIQYLVVAFVVGWAFEALRERERLRLVAEAERVETERELAAEQEKTGRLEERSMIARQLHDSVLQTLKLISASADDPGEIRYLARVQERDLRRTINEYRSPFKDSFRARLLDARAAIEDRYRVEIEQVINDDAEMDDRLRAVVDAASEAMNNAARHSGSKRIDVFAEIRYERLLVNVRDRGSGFDPARGGSGIAHSIVERVADVGGHAEIRSAPGRGTEVQIDLPLT